MELYIRSYGIHVCGNDSDVYDFVTIIIYQDVRIKGKYFVIFL